MLRCGWAHRTHHGENNKTGHERKGNRKKEGKKKKICGNGKRYRWLHSTSQSIHENGTERNEIPSAAASATHTHIRSAPQRQERDTTGANVYHPPIPRSPSWPFQNDRTDASNANSRRVDGDGLTGTVGQATAAELSTTANTAQRDRSLVRGP